MLHHQLARNMQKLTRNGPANRTLIFTTQEKGCVYVPQCLTFILVYSRLITSLDCSIRRIKSLFHNDIAHMYQQDDPDDPQNPEAWVPTYENDVLCLFCAMYFVLAVVTYGMAVPSGLFVPCILIGASMGRVIGQVWF